MSNVPNYRVYCLTEKIYRYVFSETVPTECPFNASHDIDPNRIWAFDDGDIHTALIDPGNNDDWSQGHYPGSIWENLATKQSYICVDNTVGVAVWKKITVSMTADIQDFSTAVSAHSDVQSALTHIAEDSKHREINDVGIAATDLWSANKIIGELTGKTDIGHVHIASNITDFNGEVDDRADARISVQKGAVNGIATLDGSGKVPSSQLSLESVTYQGTWNALLNLPTIISSTGTKGHYYVVSVLGFSLINGINIWQKGDWIIFNGSVWEKVDNSGQAPVTSVAGKQGAVVLAAGDIASGTFANARIAASNVTQHEGAINHDNLLGFVANEHLDWTVDQGSNNVHPNNITSASITQHENSITIGNLAGAPVGSVVGLTDTQTLTNKTLVDNTTFLADEMDGTKKVRFQLSGISTATTRTMTVPNANFTIVGADTSQTLTGKTINATSNTITNIANAQIKAAAAIDTTKLANGTVSNTEFQYLDGVTSAIQTQLNAKAASSHTHAAADVTSGTFADARIAASNVTQHQGSINHDSLSGFVANEHINHDTVSITAGVGLSGGGTIAATRTIDLDINGLTADATPDGAADYIVTWDASATTHKKVLLDNLPVGGGGGDVSGPASSLDMEMLRFNGTTGKLVEGTGLRHYGASATDPVSPTPQAGDKYYNTAINHEMCYDGTRGKWLSVAIIMDGGGRNGTTPAGTYYKRWNGMTMAASEGPHVAKGTIIRIGYSTSNAVTHTYEVLLNGTVIASLASGGSATAFDDTVNADFAAGILTSRNAAGGATTSNFQSTIWYKLRA